MFSVLFGLSMDYEVYLISRMQEEWRHLAHIGLGRSLAGQGVRRNNLAVTAGQAKSGPTIVAAALVMILVFGSFLLNNQRVIQEFGFGLAFAVLVDALIIRSVLVPATMHLIGPKNWAMPPWLDRILPNLSVEADEATEHTEPRDSIPAP
jgi:putative drug exporter of the RND superfamily